MSDENLPGAQQTEGGDDSPPKPSGPGQDLSQAPATVDPRLIWGIWAALLVAVAAAGYLLRSYMLSTYGVEAFESACNFGGSFNCDRINTSEWGKLQGVPLTVFAIPTYLAMAALAWLGAGEGGKARAALRLVRVGAALAVVYGLFLLFVMVTIEQTYCLFCLSMDAAAVVVLVLATKALARHPSQEEPAWGSPLLVSLVVGGALFALALMWFGDRKESLVATQIAHMEAASAAAEAALSQEPPPAAAAAAPAVPGAPAANQSASDGAPGSAYTGAARKLAGNKYEVPVHADDPTLGPADAKVTIVQYADFQCPYCKKIFYALQSIAKRYEGKSVRIVFKHFPMNTLCNTHVENNRHPYACNASLAAECAREQGKFWQMHDILFKNQHKLKGADLRHYIGEIGADLDRYVACMKDPEPRRILKRHMDEAALGLEIKATPRTFVNGTLYQGAVSEELLDHAIKQALGKAAASDQPETAASPGPPPAEAAAAGGAQARAIKAKGYFWIDAYEASVDAQGRALSLPNVQPANATWFEAKAACEKAGKRLCTTEEWVSACQGKAAIDDDNDGNFANDYVEGNQFPYADYFEDSWCRVDEDRIEGRPGPTGSKAWCHTPTGIFDMAGNVEEWVGLSAQEAMLIGGDFRASDKASCYRVHDSFGPGHRNHSIGFRCCSGKPTANVAKEAVAKQVPDTMVGKQVPKFQAVDLKGNKVNDATFRDKVTFLTFFASWCTPCKRELPELMEMVAALGPRGFQVVAIGVDTDDAAARTFADGMKLSYPVVLDPDAKLLGLFDVQNMPTGYIVDRNVTIRHKQVGFGADTQKEMLPIIEGLMGGRPRAMAPPPGTPPLPAGSAAPQPAPRP